MMNHEVEEIDLLHDDVPPQTTTTSNSNTPFVPTPEQAIAMEAITSCINVSLTGVPGAGKTTMLKYIVSELVRAQTDANFADACHRTTHNHSSDSAKSKESHPELYEQCHHAARAAYPVVATTGFASQILGEGATTWQSWLGVGSPANIKSLKEDWLKRLGKKPEVVSRLRQAIMLIIEEASMMSPDALAVIDYVLKHVRNFFKERTDKTDYLNKPFGGVVVVISGDPHQLGPVYKDLAFDAIPELFVDSPLIEQYGFKKIHLTQSCRQRGDPVFLTLLNNLRNNQLTNVDRRALLNCISTLEAFVERFQKAHNNTEIRPIELYCNNADVKRSNMQRLVKLADTKQQQIEYFVGSVYITRMDYVETVKMLALNNVTNRDLSEFNTIQSSYNFKMLSLNPEELFPTDRVVAANDYNTPTTEQLNKLGFFDYGEPVPGRLVAHPDQPKTLFVGVDNDLPTDELLCAQTVLKNDMKHVLCLPLCVGAQVILTYNLNQLEGLVNGASGIIIGFTKSAPQLCLDAETDEHDLNESCVGWPIVKFVNGKERVIKPVLMQYDVNLTNYNTHIRQRDRAPPNTYYYALPLLLAWSLTIHSAQGQTLDAAYIHLPAKWMQYGQFYTGVSRLTRLEWLGLSHFNESLVRCNPNAVRYEQSIMMNHFAEKSAAAAANDNTTTSKSTIQNGNYSKKKHYAVQEPEEDKYHYPDENELMYDYYDD